MHVSMLLPSLPLAFELAVKQAAALGFSHVDVVALQERPEAHLEALAARGLLVACAAVGRCLPEGCSLDAPSVDARRLALAEMKRQVTDAARLGATNCYVVPGLDATSQGLVRFTEGCARLADFAEQRQIRLCVEHFPGSILSGAKDVLDWLQQTDHSNLALLLDVGHCLISKEDPAQVIDRARASLGYIHFDDNDGVSDAHWPLLTGRLTLASLEAVAAALRRISYRGALSLELNPQNREPVEGLRSGKAVLESLLAGQ
jgi:sugar phosphate isomerase/epimerase